MSIKERILNIITGIAFMVLLLAISAFDSEDLTIPIIMFVVSLGWLILYSAADDGESED